MTTKQIKEIVQAVGGKVTVEYSDDTTRTYNIADAMVPSIGEIRYLKNPPTEAGWLACNGQPYLRTTYPQYEAQRPDPALVFTDVTATSQEFTRGWVLSNGSVLYITPYISASAGSRLRRSTDQMVSSTLVKDQSCAYWAISQLPSGRVVAIDWNSTNCYYSDDFGVTWTTVTAAHPTISPKDGLCAYNLMGCISGSTTLRIPISHTNKILKTSDGITWIEETANFTDFYPTMTVFPSISGGYPEEGYANYMMYYGRGLKDTNLELWHSGILPYGGADLVEYTSRPGAVMFSLIADGKRYELCNQVDNILSVGISGVSKTLLPATVGVEIKTLTIVNGLPVGLNKSNFMAGNIVSWLSPDRTTVESGTLDVPASVMTIPSDGHSFQLTFPTFTLMLAGGEGVRILKISVDALKFQAPGLAKLGGNTPYIYIGN